MLLSASRPVERSDVTTMERVLVVGSSGAGKTTLARALATALDTTHVELDALFQGPNWQPRPSFVEEVERASREPRWVIEGNYAPVRELLWARADTVVWLDLPRLLVEYRVVRRSLLRWLTREQLWNGNYEPSPLWWTDREHPVRWSWIKTTQYRAEYPQRFADPTYAHVANVRLRSRAEVARFLAHVVHAVSRSS